MVADCSCDDFLALFNEAVAKRGKRAPGQQLVCEHGLLGIGWGLNPFNTATLDDWLCPGAFLPFVSAANRATQLNGAPAAARCAGPAAEPPRSVNGAFSYAGTWRRRAGERQIRWADTTAKKARSARMQIPPRPIRLTPRQLARRVFYRLRTYENLSSLEQFAMFMGKAQVLELGLKHLLTDLFNYEHEQMERWTMGRTVRELKARGLRGDYIGLLEDFVDYRNYIAHEYLANEALLRRILGSDIGRLEYKYLERGIFKVEEALVVYDWLEKHQLWLSVNKDFG